MRRSTSRDRSRESHAREREAALMATLDLAERRE
jgi:hypothetical protein